MKLTTLINLRVLYTCLTLLSIHACAMTHFHGYPTLYKIMVFPLTLFALITLTLFLIKPRRIRKLSSVPQIDLKVIS